MLLRRKRILYRRPRYFKFPPRSSTAPQKAVPSSGQRGLGSQSEVHLANHSAPDLQEPRCAASSLAVTATTLNMEQWKKESAPSIISRPKTIHWSRHEQLGFLRAPLRPIRRRLKSLKEQHLTVLAERLESFANSFDAPQDDDLFPDHDIEFQSRKAIFEAQIQADLNDRVENDRIACNNGSTEVTCPYCCCALMSSIVTNNKKLIEHVKYDIIPYVCLFDTCDTPDELYNHSEDWRMTPPKKWLVTLIVARAKPGALWLNCLKTLIFLGLS
ncbi:hypothetical protein BDW62DRAFT_85943 [Aspergillus aurantiobrunneus]